MMDTCFCSPRALGYADPPLIRGVKTDQLRLVMWVLRTTHSKNLGHQGLGELPWLVILCICCHTSLLGELSAVCVTPLEKGNWKLMPGFSWTPPYVIFFLC